MLAVPVGTQGDQGSCDLPPILLELSQSETDAGYASLEGSSGAGELVCTGITDAATLLSGISDTVISLPAGAVTGTIGWLCDAPPSLIPGCPVNAPRRPWITLQLAGQTFSGKVGHDLMTGEFSWAGCLAVGCTTFLYGTWRAARSTDPADRLIANM